MSGQDSAQMEPVEEADDDGSSGPEYTSSALSDKVKQFLTGFQDGDGERKYVKMIDEMMPRETRHIVIDYNDLIDEREIADMFVHSPDLILAAFSRAIGEILQVRFYDYAEQVGEEIRARLSNYPLMRSLRKINADTIGTMTSVSGMVVRASEVNPLAKELVYACGDGHYTKIVQIKGMDTKPPAVCDNPDCKLRDFELKPESSKFIDFQILRLQELPEDLPPGQLPDYIDIMVKQDLVDNARPGDRVALTGLVRVEQESVAGIARTRSSLYRLRLEGNNIEFLGGRSKASRKIERESISPEDERAILALKQDPDIYGRLIESFAPHIKGQHLIKEAILLLMVGSVQRERADGSKIRGDINVFLVGDPGTAKSEMLKFCSRTAPRGLYTSGRGSTAAGLTASVVRDKTGIMMLEAGAVVLGDQGMVAIDEFDKMSAEDRSALHEVMEQQSASIAKGGIVATLNARTSILAAANPLYGKYDPFRNITENINLPIPLLSRFDLIFVVRDQPSVEMDTEIAQHVIRLHSMQGADTANLIDADTLTKYLAYAKRFTPKMTKEAEQMIVDYYIRMRKMAQSEDMTPVTARQLEGLIRISTARARLLMKDMIEKEDAERAIYLLEQMLQDAGVDVNTGEIDVGVLRGRPRSEVTKMQLFMDILGRLSGEQKEPVEDKALITELENTEKFTADEARNFIEKLKRDGVIYERHPGFYSKA